MIFRLGPVDDLWRISHEKNRIVKVFAEPLNYRPTIFYGAVSEASHQRCNARVQRAAVSR